MDSLYEAVQSSSDGPPRPIPSRSSSRSCSRSCSPAVLLDDNAKWRGSGRSISMVSGTHTLSYILQHTPKRVYKILTVSGEAPQQS